MLGVIWSILAILLLGRRAVADTKSALTIEAPLTRVNLTAVRWELANYNDSMLPLLSKDFTLLQQAVDTIEDSSCRDQCQLVVAGLQNLTEWAVKFYDASGKFPEGVLSGSVFQLGDYDECLGIGTGDDGAPQGVRGQYCLSEIGVKVSQTYLNTRGSIWRVFSPAEERYQEPIDKLYFGICVPAACSARVVEEVLGKMLGVSFSGSRLKFTPKVLEGSCYKDEPISVNTLDIIYACLALSVILIVLGGTLFHALYFRGKTKESNGLVPQILLAFSVISNHRKILSPAHDNDLYLDCISGIKFMSMVFIVAGHALIFILGGPIANRGFYEKVISRVENSIFVNNPLLVDTFLLLSGFLFCRILLHELDKRKSVNFLLLYVFRYVRLTPTYFMMVGLYVTWLPKFDSGPFWSRMEVEKQRCLSSWWANLLYVNNYVETGNLCMFQSWYLSVDTQLFILAPAIIYPLWKWRRYGESLLISATTLSIVIPFVVTLMNDLDPTLMIYTSEIKDISTNEYFRDSYIKTHMRAQSYCFGLMYGYIVYRVQTSEYKLSKKLVRSGWLFSALSLVLSLCCISVFYGPRQHFTPLEAAFYSSLHRAFWSLGTGWVVLACITDNSGPIRNFLKWRPFVPLSRLTYCAYLINGLVELYSSSTLRSPHHLGYFQLTSIVISHIVFTFVGAYVLSLLFESPVFGLEKIFLKHGKRTQENKTKQEASASPS